MKKKNRIRIRMKEKAQIIYGLITMLIVMSTFISLLSHGPTRQDQYEDYLVVNQSIIIIVPNNTNIRAFPIVENCSISAKRQYTWCYTGTEYYQIKESGTTHIWYGIPADKIGHDAPLRVRLWCIFHQKCIIWMSSEGHITVITSASV